MDPLYVSKIHSSLPRWTSVIQVIEASHTKTTHTDRASRVYQRFVFADSHGVKVSAVAFDDNVARTEGLLAPFKKYCISGTSVEEIPKSAPANLYRFFWIINRDTLIKEVFEPEMPTLLPYFDLTPFTSFQHLADSQVSINMMGIVLHALPMRSLILMFSLLLPETTLLLIRDAIGSIESKPVIVVFRVRVKTDNYLSLCTKATSVVSVSPRIQEVTRLEQWYCSNCSKLMASVLDKRYCNPFLLLSPINDNMLSTISGVVAANQFLIGASWIKGRVVVDRLHRLWHLACPYCFAPNNFIETLGISCVACLKDLYVFPRARVKLAVTAGSASIDVVALGYVAEKLIGFTAYQLSQAEHECVNLNLRVADALDRRVLCCYVSRSPESIQMTGVSFTIVTSYLVGEAGPPIILSLWNKFFESEGKILMQLLKKRPVFICRRLKVVSYNGIALSTRNDSVLLIDSPVGDASQLKNWAMRNESQFAILVQEKTYNMHGPSMFHQSKHKLSTIQAVLTTQKATCDPKCRFDVDLTDDIGVMTASLFSELAEQLLGTSAVAAMNFYNKNEELPLELIHDTLKSKTFIAQVKPGNTKDDGTYQRYTIVYYFEDNKDHELFEEQPLNSSHVASQLSVTATPDHVLFPTTSSTLIKKQNVSEATSQSSAINISDKPCGSSKTRVCLAKRIDLSEETESAISKSCDIASSKKPRNA